MQASLFLIYIYALEIESYLHVSNEIKIQGRSWSHKSIVKPFPIQHTAVCYVEQINCRSLDKIFTVTPVRDTHNLDNVHDDDNQYH